MKKTIAVMLALAMAMTLTAFALGEEISPDELLNAWNQGQAYNLFDVRDAEKYNERTLSGAENVPLDQWGDFLQQVLDGDFDQMDTAIYVFGENAEQGRAAADTAALLGFTNVRFLASADAWAGPTVSLMQPLGDLATEDTYGNAVGPGLIEGKKLVMINVWGTYCGPCVNEMSGLGSLAKEMEKDGVMILGLVIDCQNQDMTANEAQTEKARGIAEQTGALYPHILPNAHMMQNMMTRITAVPTTIFVTGDGKTVGQWYIGARSEEEWRTIILSTLEGLEE